MQHGSGDWRLDGLITASHNHAWYYCSPSPGRCRFSHVGKFLRPMVNGDQLARDQVPAGQAAMPGHEADGHVDGRRAAANLSTEYLARQAFLTSVLKYPPVTPAIDYRLSGPSKYLVFPRLSLKPIAAVEFWHRHNLSYRSGDSREVCRTGDSLQVWRLGILIDLLQVLQAIHQMGFVHRQVDPQHILVDASGRLVVTGFGRCLPVGTPVAADGRSAQQTSRAQQTSSAAPSPRLAGPADDIYAVGKWLIHWLGNKALDAPLVQAMLSEEPVHRPSAGELLELLRPSLAQAG